MEKHLLVGTLLPGATPIHNENINPVWRGNVVIGNYRRSMYVKSVDKRTLAVEVMCAVLGRALELPMPRPALVMVHPEAIQGLSQPSVFFGSESVDNPDLKQWLNKDADSTAKQLLGWAKLLDAGCFDEWVANYDRHGGNILYGGGQNFALIDHSEALPRALKADEAAAENKLLSFSANGKKDALIEQLYGQAKTRTSGYSTAHIYKVVLDVLSASSGQHTVDELTAFLSQRTNVLLALIASRIGYKQESLELPNVTISRHT